MLDKIITAILNLIKPRALYTIMFFGVTGYMLITKVEIPDLLRDIDIALLAFYFGEKSTLDMKNGNGNILKNKEFI